MDSSDVEILGREAAYDGYLKIQRLRMRHRLYAGGTSGEIAREVIERGHAVAVLPYDPVRDEVVMIEQLRIGALLRGDAAPWLLEVIAGVVEPGEEGHEVARRESLEEAGLTIDEVTEILTHYTSPGILTETITLYHATVDAASAGGVHSLAAEGEEIRVHVLGFEAALAALAEGRITSGPAVVALQWLALNRAALRGEAGVDGADG